MQRFSFSRGAAAVILTGVLTASCATVDLGTPPRMPDLAAAPDGRFPGEAQVGPVFARVEVQVSGHRIEGFTVLEHRCGLGRKAESLAGEVVARQTVELDAVSGATASSRALLKAGEAALRGAVEGRP